MTIIEFIALSKKRAVTPEVIAKLEARIIKREKQFKQESDSERKFNYNFKYTL